MLNYIIDVVVVAAIYLFPFVVLLLFVAPLIVIKLRRKRFTPLNVIISLLLGAALAAGAIFAAYWAIMLLGAVAVYQLYGVQI